MGFDDKTSLSMSLATTRSLPGNEIIERCTFYQLTVPYR